MTRPLAPIDRVLADKRFLGFDMRSRAVWSTVWKAAYALPLTPDERNTFTSIAGGREPPKQRVREVWVNAGRRSGKSEMAAAAAIHVALFVKHKLSRGEVGYVLVLAGTRDQAQTVFTFIRELLEDSPALRKEVTNVTQEEIEMENGIVIAVHANSFRSVRGKTLCACVFDEVCFWRDESSAVPDLEVYRAVSPALATTKGMLIGISSPYRRVGLLFQKFRDYYGVNSNDTLVIKGSTRQFNPTLDEAEIARQKAADPGGASSEWDAEFRDDLSTYLDDRILEANIDYSRPRELPPQPSTYHKAFCDASGGGTHGDAYTLAIAHKSGETFIIDAVRGVPGPFDPYAVTREFASLCKQYGVSTVTGDKWGKEWVQSAWRGSTVAYVQSALAKSDIYLECIPLFTRGLVRLPNHPQLLRELRLLAMQRHSGGRVSVDHPRGEHDDYANAVCGVLRSLSAVYGYDFQYKGWDPDYVPPDAQPKAPAADQRLHDLYAAIQGAIDCGRIV